MVFVMRVERLASLLERPEIQRLVTANRVQQFSIGVDSRVDQLEAPMIVVRVPTEEEAEAIPSEVELDGETIRVVKRLGYRVPKPLRALG